MIVADGLYNSAVLTSSSLALMLKREPTFEMEPVTMKSAPRASPSLTASSDETIPDFETLAPQGFDLYFFQRPYRPL